MNEEREVRPGFLPPRPGGGSPVRERPGAPGGEPAGWAPPRPPEPHRWGGGPEPRAPQPGAPQGSQRPVFTTGRDPGDDAPSSPLAVGSMVMSAVSIVLLVMSIGVAFLFSLLLGSAALAMAMRQRRRVAAGRPGRPGQARAAFTLAVVAVALAAVAAVTWLILQSAGFTPEDLERWLRDELERQRDGGGGGGGGGAPAGDPA